MSQKDNALKKVFDSTALEWKFVRLNTEQASEFADYIVDESTLLKKANTVKKEKNQGTFRAVLQPQGKFLQVGDHTAALDSTKRQKFENSEVTYSTKLVRGAVDIRDDELQDNIEGKSVTDHILSIIAKEVAIEMEEISIYGIRRPDTTVTSVLDLFNGAKYQIEQNGNVISANAAGFSDRYMAKDKLSKLVKALATKYRRGVEFLMPEDIAIDYDLLFDTVAEKNVRDELKSIAFKKPLIEVPLMKNDAPVPSTTAALTTVNGAVTADGTEDTVTLTDASGLSDGDYIAFDYGTNKEIVYQIDSILTNDVTLTEALKYNVANAATVHKVTLDGSDVILTNPKNFNFIIQTWDYAMEIEPERIASVGWTYHFKARVDVVVSNPSAAWILRYVKSK